MNTQKRKILCSTAIITLLNLSFSPLYAGTERDPSLQEELNGIKRTSQSLEESSKAEALSSQLSNRHSKRAIGDPVSNDFRINQGTTGGQIRPSVAELTNENTFVVWDGSNIYGRIFYPNGTALTNEFILNQDTGPKHSSSVQSLTNGNVFVTWASYQNGNVDIYGNNKYDIYGRVFDSQGTAISNDFGINQNTTGKLYMPSFVGLTNGNVFLAWESGQTGTPNIYGRVFSPQGTPLTNEFSINQAISGYQYNPRVASLTNGNAFVAWHGLQTGIFPNDVSGRVFDSTGTAISNEFLIYHNFTGKQYYPSVKGLTNGNALVAWAGDQKGTDNANFDIYVRAFDPQGTAINAAFGINQDTTGSASVQSPSVTSLTNGNAFITWKAGSGTRNIYGRVFDPQGTAITTEFSIVSGRTRLVTSLSNGNVFVAWDDLDAQQRLYIYGRVFSPQGTAISNYFSIYYNATLNVFGAPVDGIASVVGLTNGNAFVAWTQERGSGTGYDVYGRIMSGQGVTSPTGSASPTSSTSFTSAPTSSASPTSSTSFTSAPTNSASPTSAPTSSAGRPTPLLLIPAKVVMDGGKILWDFATTKTWKSLEAIEDAERKERPRFSRTIETPQKVVNYVKSWFSSNSWSEYFDSMEKSVLDYSQSVVVETPSYQNAYFGKSTLNGNTSLMSNVSYTSTIGAGFLPHSFVSGTIGQ